MRCSLPVWVDGRWGFGKDAHVFALPDFSRLVLRASNCLNGLRGSTESLGVDAAAALQPLREQLTARPIHYDARSAWMLKQPELGLPRAVVLPVTHRLACQSSITPAQAFTPSDNDEALPYWVLRKCTGERPGNAHAASYDELQNLRETGPGELPNLQHDAAMRVFEQKYVQTMQITARSAAGGLSTRDAYSCAISIRYRPRRA